MTILSYMRMVLWSFIGIRRRASAAREIGAVSVPALVATGLVMAAGFVSLLVGAVHLGLRWFT